MDGIGTSELPDGFVLDEASPAGASKVVDTVADRTGSLPAGFVLDSQASAPQPSRPPADTGTRFSDYPKALASGLVEGVGSAVSGVGSLAKLVSPAHYTDDLAQSAGASPSVQKVAHVFQEVADAPANALQWAGNKISQGGQAIAGTESEGAQQAAAKNVVEGSLLHPSTWRLGEGATDPRSLALKGLGLVGGLAPMLVAPEVAGVRALGMAGKASEAAGAAVNGIRAGMKVSEMAPEVAAQVPAILKRVGRVKQATVAAVGGPQMAEGAAQGEQARIEQMAPEDLAQLPAYQQAIAAGQTPDEARATLAQRAHDASFAATIGPSLGMSVLSALPLLNSTQGVLAKAVGTSRLKRAVAGAALEAPIQGAAFTGQNAASIAATNLATGEQRSPLEDSAATFGSGALMGGLFGIAGGLHRPTLAGPVGRAAQTAQESGAAEPYPGAAPGSLADVANVLHRNVPIDTTGGVTSSAEPPASAPTAEQPASEPALRVRVPPPLAPWVDAATDEATPPSDNQVLLALHQLRDQTDALRAEGKNPMVSRPQLAAAWGIPTKRLSDLMTTANAERKRGVTTTDAQTRLDQNSGDLPQVDPAETLRASMAADAAGTRQLRAEQDAAFDQAGQNLVDIRARLAALQEPQGSENATSNDVAKPEQTPAATDVTQGADATARQATEPAPVAPEPVPATADTRDTAPPTPPDALPATEPAAAAPSVASEPARAPEPVAAPEAGVPPAGAEAASVPADQAAREVPVSSSESSDRSGVKAQTTVSVGEKQPAGDEQSAAASVRAVAVAPKAREKAVEAVVAPGDNVTVTGGVHAGKAASVVGRTRSGVRLEFEDGSRATLSARVVKLAKKQDAGTAPETAAVMAASTPSEVTPIKNEPPGIPGAATLASQAAHQPAEGSTGERTTLSDTSAGHNGVAENTDKSLNAEHTAGPITGAENKAVAGEAPSAAVGRQGPPVPHASDSGSGRTVHREPNRLGTAQGLVNPETPPRGDVSVSGKAGPIASNKTDAIGDIGEKIGEARKDTATKTGSRRARAATPAQGGEDAPGWRKRYEVTQIAASSRPGEVGRWAINDKRLSRTVRYIGGRGVTDRTFSTRAEAEAAVPLVEVARNHRTGLRDKDNWGIYRRIGARKRVWVKDGFKTDAEATRYMATHATDLIETKTSVGEEALPKPETVSRTGPVRRTSNVESEQFRDAFGFRAVEFGNWNSQAERQEVMNHAYDGLHDLAELLGVPPKAISLNGELGLAFGARGQGLGGARAHYERDHVVMNLTKMQGAGALAHEWFHALDHYLGRDGGTGSTKWQTQPDGTRVLDVRGRGLDFASGAGNRAMRLRAELREAFVSLINTMHRTAGTFVRDSGKLERFTGRARDDLAQQLARLHDHLATEQTWGAREKKAPASAEQLAEFDAIATKLLHGEGLDLRRVENKAAPGHRFSPTMRTTNDDLERLSAIMKAVRGRSGFTAQGGWLVDIANAIRRYDVRLKEAADAKVNPVAPTTKPTSFTMEAIKADQGRGTDYWSTPHEMAARAFSSYIEDKLKAAGRHNDFLSFGSDERVALPIPERPHPFPAGEERVAIDKAFDTFFETVKTREDEAGHVALFSRLAGDRAPARGRGIDAAQLDRRVSFITRSWHGDKPNVRVVDSAEQLPVAARAEGGYKRAEGYYDGKDTIYLVRENLRTAADVDRVLARHEVTHYGLDRIMDDAVPGGWKRFTAETQAMRADPSKLDATTRKAVQSTEERYRNANGAPASADVFAAELPAVMAEQGVRNRLLDRVVTAIRAHLRKWFPHLELSPREVRQFIVQAHALVAGDGRVAREQAQKQRAMVAAPAFDKAPDTFYSALNRAIALGKGMPKKAEATVWKQWLDGAQRRGAFKGAEREWTGLDQWLDEHNGPVTRADLNDFVRQNQVRVQEVVHGDEVTPDRARDIVEDEDGNFVLQGDAGETAGSAKFGEYTLPGGKNYRELLLTLPQRDALTSTERAELGRLTERKQTAELGRSGVKPLSAEETARLGALQDKAIAGNNPPFRSQHFDEPNIVAHVRMNDRTGPDGEKILHVEEVQSDMHQAGRKSGYVTAEARTEAHAAAAKLADAKRAQADAVHAYHVAFDTGSDADVARANTVMMKAARAAADAAARVNDIRRNQGIVPDAPFKKTEQWSMLAMKRVLRYAADHGYDKVTWTTGEQQAARYDLSKTVDRLLYLPDEKGGVLFAYGKDGRQMLRREDVKPEQLADYVGKEAAHKLIEQPTTDGARGQQVKELRGADLKMGGEGMKAFYDRMLPNELNKYAKQWGAKVEESAIETRPARELRNEMDLTDLGEPAPRDNGTRTEPAQTATVHSIDITPAMRESVQQGQPMFARPEPPALFKPDTRDATRFRDDLRATMADRRTMVPPVRLGDTSAVLRALGAKDLPIDISRDTVRKATNGVKHVVPMDVIERLPEELHDPLAVFKSRTHPDSLVVLTEHRDARGSPVVVALDLRALGEKYQVNRIASVYGKDGARPLDMWVKDGMLAYKSNRAERSPVLDGLQLPNRMTGDFGQGKVLTEADVQSRFGELGNLPEKPDGSFSKPEPATPEHPADPSREPGRAFDAQANVLRERDATAFQRAKDWLSGKWEDVRPKALSLLMTNHVTELMHNKAPFKGLVQRYERSLEQLDADRQILVSGAPDAKDHPTDMLKKGAIPISDDLQRFAYGHGAKGLANAARGNFTPEAKRTFDVMHEATIAGVDPDKAYARLTIRNARGDRTPWTKENVAERLKLNKELAMQRGGDAWSDSREALADERKYLKALPRLEKKREADYARMKAKFDALPEEGKRMYRETRDWYARYSEETEKALIKNIEALDVPETYRRSLVQRMRMQFEDARAEGVYFPLNRNGDYWIAYRTPDGKNGFEMFEQFGDQRQRERELTAAGNRIDATGRRDKNAKAKEAPSGTFVREIIDVLAKAKVSEEVQDQVYQAYLQMMPDLSMRKHAIHRGNVIGYDKNVPRTFAKFSFHGAYQLAKLRHSQDMQFSLDAMGASLDNWRKRSDKFPGAKSGELEKFMEATLARYEANPDGEVRAAAEAKLDDNNQFNGFTGALDALANRVASAQRGPRAKVEREAWEGLAKRWRDLPQAVRRAYTLEAAEKFGLHEPKSSADIAKMDALLGELRKRHDWIMNPTDQQLANMVNSIGFIYYLGASPASALTNLTQIVQMTLPYLGARHGWNKASRMLWAAWRDAARTGGNMGRLLKTDEERRAFLEMQQRGIFSRTQGHTLAGVAEGNVLQGNPAWARVMNGISWMFHNAELVNRQATGMAAFRIARSEGKSFDEALGYARQVNVDTNYDYSAANRARFMQGNVPRILFQFKGYSIGSSWLFWKNFHDAFRGETPEVRRVAKRTAAGIAGMTALLAGATGLPLYNTVRMTANAANTLFGDDDQPWNFDDAFHRWLADNLGQDAARLVAEGPTNYLTGANLASRTSMANLWIHDDDQRLEGADAYHALLENIAGPASGILQNYYVGSEDVRRGHLWRGVERMLPTSVKNAMKAMRYAHEGVNSLRGDPIVPDVSGYEDFLQAIGFQPANVANQYRINTALMNFTGEVSDRRGNLMNAYAIAVRSGDGDDQQNAMRKIASFNRAHPEVAITRPVLMSSLRQRALRSAQATNGVILNRKLAAGAREFAGVQ